MVRFLLLGLSFLTSVCWAQTYHDMIQNGGYTLHAIQDSAEAYFTTHPKGKGSGYMDWKRWEYNALHSVMEDGKVPDAHFYSQELDRYNAQLNQASKTEDENFPGNWRSLGPTETKGVQTFDPGIGRLTSIAIDPNNEKHILVGSQTGGVWKSTDGGKNWVSLSDFLVNLRVYSLTIDPFDPDIYYWGINHGSVFKSIDAGKTWKEIEFDGRGNIHQISANPIKKGELMLTDTYAGVFRSTDHGETWHNVLSGKCYDIERHRTDTSIVYASGDSIWKSTDGGRNFSSLDFNHSNNQPKMIAVSRAAPKNLYVIQCNGKRMEGIYLSRNGGSSFLKMSKSGENLLGYSMQGTGSLGQAPRNMEIAVSDNDSNEVYVGGINIWRSLDGAKTFSIVSHHSYTNSFPNLAYTHADIEVLLYDNSGRLWVGSDGGLYRMDTPSSLTIGKNSFVNLSNGLGIQQIYRLGISQSDPCIVSVGSQDNGSAVFKEGTWFHYHGGDGTETVVIDNKRHTLFASSQNGSFVYSEDGRTSKPVTGLYSKFGSGKWVTAFEKDPTDTNTLYAGYDYVYRSTDFGKTFEPISQKFHPSHIKVAPTGSDTIYAASAYFLYRTTDGGKTEWDRLLYGNLTRFEINSISVHPKNANWVALAVAGSTKFLITKDGGKNWTEWKENLPAFQSLTTVWNNDSLETIYLGLEVGVYYRNKNMTQWEPFNKGLPNVKVNELEINQVTNEIYAATYGRGVWVSPLSNSGVSGIEALNLNTNIVVSPNPVALGTPLNVSIDLTGVHEVFIFDMLGRAKYRNTQVRGTSCLIPTNNLQQGMYVIRIKTDHGMVTRKVVIR
ncbi:MAG: T9SS type A sorting domain-containing protein [Bacteroidia bacterium]|nr:T9SS type A sorting domain-containing protein [Bacteroidia bacterium]